MLTCSTRFAPLGGGRIVGELCWTGCVATCDSCSSTIAKYFIAFHCCSMFMWMRIALQSLWMEATFCNVCETPHCDWLMTSGYSISLQATLECTCKSRQNAPMFFAYQKAPDSNILHFWLMWTQWLYVGAVHGTMYSGADQTAWVQTSSLEDCQPLGLAKSSLYTYTPSQSTK